MKFQFSLSMLVASAAAQSLSTGGQVVLSALNAIADATAQLNTDVQAYNGGAITTLQNDLGPVLSAINDGKAAVAATSDLVVSDATGILTPLQDLTKTVTASIDNTVAKKDLFDAAGYGYTILLSLQSILSATNSFIDTVNSKLGPLATAGPTLEKPITDALSSGVAAFADEKPAATGAPSATAPPNTFSSLTLPTQSASYGSRSRSRPVGSASGSRAISSKKPTSPPYVTPTGPAGPTGTGYHPSVSAPPFTGAAVPAAAAGYGAIFLAGAAAVLAM